jgi:hypothetical protein
MILTDEERAELVGNVANIGDGLRIARAIESAVLRKLRERPADAWGLMAKVEDGNWNLQYPIRFSEADAKVDRTMYEYSTQLRVVQLHIIPEEHE